jgi:predicted TPR repeat methyltransferase
MTGVDLSPKMLARAKQRNIYDHFACAEITAFLMESPDSFDVILAADVFIYFGDLFPLKSAITKVLRPNGLLAFSIERTTSANHHLLPSGRFAHAVEYIRSVFGAEFIECVCQETILRHEANQPVAGNIFVYHGR